MPCCFLACQHCRAAFRRELQSPENRIATATPIFPFRLHDAVEAVSCLVAPCFDPRYEGSELVGMTKLGFGYLHDLLVG